MGPNISRPKFHTPQKSKPNVCSLCGILHSLFIFISRANDWRYSTSNLSVHLHTFHNLRSYIMTLRSWFPVSLGFDTGRGWEGGGRIRSDEYKFKRTKMLCLSSECCILSVKDHIVFYSVER